MNSYLIIFPHQLHKEHLGLKYKPEKIFIVEDSLFFFDHQYPVNFHKQKLILHRASMKQYQDHLTSLGFDVEYRDYQVDLLEKVIETIALSSPKATVMLSDTADYTLNKRVKSLASYYGIELHWIRSQLFLNTNQQNKDYRSDKKRWFMASFYQFQRTRLNILMQDDGKPVGGKWSFDEDNRKKIPTKDIPLIPPMNFPEENSFIREAKKYVHVHFPDALGSDHFFYYPTNFKDAEVWLENFLTLRLERFGPYEDALVPQDHWLYHSVLTPMLNIGLLSPDTIIEKAIQHSQANQIPLASIEGFVRQIIGWREFMRATYVDLGVQMRTTNHWQHTRKIPPCFYDGTTGITPIDDIITHILNTGYCHHIERLMVLGGFMFLCEFDPDEIYRWFMELFIDSYDWVMVTNVYAMSQNADGGLITTKPYFSGSNYLKKMGYGNTKQNASWAPTWDGLYWRWIHLHQDQLSKNPRWAMMCAMSRKMEHDKMSAHIARAEEFLLRLEQQQ